MVPVGWLWVVMGGHGWQCMGGNGRVMGVISGNGVVIGGDG